MLPSCCTAHKAKDGGSFFSRGLLKVKKRWDHLTCPSQQWSIICIYMCIKADKKIYRFIVVRTFLGTEKGRNNMEAHEEEKRKQNLKRWTVIDVD